MCREMKDSGVQWIGSVPKHWDIIKVKKAFKRKNVKAMIDNPTILSLTSKGIKVRDITNNEGQIAESYYNYNLVDIGDLLLNPMDLVTNAFSSVSNIKGVISPAYFNLQALDGYNAKYYDYYFKLQYWGLAFFAHGKGVSFENRWTLNNETLMNYKIPYPVIKEQNIIVEFLDKKLSQIDDIISKQKSLIEKYKAYKQSLITETVTKGLNKNVPMKDSGIEWIGEIPSHWSVCKMKNIGEAIIGLTYSPEEVSDKGTLVLRSSNVQNGKIVYEDNVFVNKDISERLMTRIGDILICSRNGSRALIGKCAYIDELSAGKSFGAFMTIFRSKYNKFIYYTLNSAIFKFHIGTFLTSTINQLTTSNLSSIRITLPPKEEQQEISDFLDKKCNSIDSVIAKKERLIEKLEDYKKSLIYECVTGKREVN